MKYFAFKYKKYGSTSTLIIQARDYIEALNEFNGQVQDAFIISVTEKHHL